jgi:hypothetical protein
MSQSQAERTPNPENEDRRILRKDLRRAGWNVGEMTKVRGGVEIALWPAPHTGPADGVEARRVQGANKTEALRNALNPEYAIPPAEPTTT